MAGYAAEWIARGVDCSPVDRVSVEDGIRRCYEFAGIPWHGNVVWVRSPIVVGFAGPIASALLGHRAVRGAVGDAVHGAVRGAVHRAVRGAVGVAVDDAVHDAVDGAVDGAVRGAVDGAVRGAVGVAVRDAVHDAVGVAVDGAVHDAVGVAVDGAVRGAVRGAVHGAVGVAVRDAVHDAVDDAVHDAVDGAVRGAWWRYIGGQWWGAWSGWRSYFRDICHLDLPGDMWDRHAAYEAANQAGWWWPHQQFVIISERPTELHREEIGPAGWGSHRLHNPVGPSIAWGDEWALYHWHGMRVPAWVVEGPTAALIAAEPNAEVRRCGIESYGWDRWIGETGMVPVASDEWGDLYDPPVGLVPAGVRLLVVVNGTPERDGTVRRYGLLTDRRHTTALAAVADSYGLSAGEYATLGRRT